MKRLFSPYWILLTITLPQVVLVLLYLGAYKIIRTLLSDENFWYWIEYGGFLSFGIVSTAVYSIFLILKKRSVDVYFSFAVLAYYILYLYFFSNKVESIIPFSIPRWMFLAGDLHLYVYTFLIPGIFYALLILVVGLTPEIERTFIGANILAAVLIPIFWYIFFQIVIPLGLGKIFEVDFVRHLGAIFFIIMAVAFLFLVFRIFYVLISRWENVLEENGLIWKIPLAIIFPLMGLYLNNTQFFLVFGDFRNNWFYAIAFLNGVFVCLDYDDNQWLRLLIFIGRSVGYTFIIYFSLVFMPFLPLSIPAIIVFGIGFLMMVPAVLLIVQGQILANDFSDLQKYFHLNILRAVFIISLMFLPSLIFGLYKNDRQNLQQALASVYDPDLKKESPEISIPALKTALENIKRNKGNGRNTDIFGSGNNEGQQPFLSALYRWFVLDNLTLSDEKIGLLERIYMGGTAVTSFTRPTVLTATLNNPPIVIDSISTETQLDATNKTYKTWVHLALKNNTDGQQEYVTEFDLPEGVWVSNYYLDIENRREYGILAEKRAARWVYQQIVGTNRDPGILDYQKANRLRLRVFPFTSQQTRTTGIEFIHSEPFSLSIDSQLVTINENIKTLYPQAHQVQNAWYFSADLKTRLPKIELKPSFHFIVDMSKTDSRDAHNQAITAIEKIKQLIQLNPQEAEIILCNYRTQTVKMSDNWIEKLKNTELKGGFYLERAVQEIAVRKSMTKEGKFPILIVISPQPNKAIFSSDIIDYQLLNNGISQIYAWDMKEKLMKTTLLENKLLSLHKILGNIPFMKVLAYPNAEKPQFFLKDDQKAEIIYAEQEFGAAQIQKISTQKTWENALAFHAGNLHLKANPQKVNELWLSMLQANFRLQVLSPLTSFISLENEAQKQALLAKQQQVLKANKNLDTGEEEFRSMSEPMWFWVLAGLLIFIYFRYKKA